MLLLLAACSSAPEPVDLPAVVLEPGVPWSLPWRPPMNDWELADPVASGLDPEALAALEAYSFRRDGDDDDRLGQRTNALVIVRHGRVVYEHYARDTTKDTPLLLWSVTKSLGNLLVGAAVHQGTIHPQDAACKHYTPMCSGGREHIRIGDLLQMSSGLTWAETYETSPVFSSVMGMLYTGGSHDMAAFAASQPPEFAPGTHWRYSSGDANIVSAALKSGLGARYDAHPWRALFDPLGMDSAVLERDAAGTYVTSSYAYTSARDLAKLGQLMLDDGIWNGERLLAEGWVRYSTTLAPAFHTTAVGFEHHKSNPGAQWYLNLGDPARGLEPPWPGLPPDAFGASGHWGKAMWVIPSWDMVVVRLGDDRRYGCGYPGEKKCDPNVEAAFTKPLFTQKLGAAVRPHAPPEAPVEPVDPEQEVAP